MYMCVCVCDQPDTVLNFSADLSKYDKKLRICFLLCTMGPQQWTGSS